MILSAPLVILCRKLALVYGPMATAFQPWLATRIVWPAPGRTPSDQLESSQWPLVGLVQELVCASELIASASSPASVRAAMFHPGRKNSMVCIRFQGSQFGTANGHSGAFCAI